ncbi:chemotaxis protein CheW [Neptunicella sp. SCSIO 80796]|uniref:chemotaxis protein CheW n=1 Tax=Neptunicella plasticusilytica TaxID=3117012 RepID=UPI003A4E5DD7
MSKGTFAKEEVMEEYLSSLLTEEQPVVDALVEQKTVQHLLQQVSAEQEKAKLNQQVEISEKQHTAKVIAPAADKNEEILASIDDAQSKMKPTGRGEQVKAYRQGAFQALFFKLAGLTLAVPLTELGGIHNLDKPKPLFGKPDWFLGMMLHREEQLSVVDTARWVMPERMNETLAESLNYQYLIMLGESHWGLTCESLVNTVTLQHDDVKWRETDGKRPWLAGLVKDKMCALIDVQQMIELLDHGYTSNAK